MSSQCKVNIDNLMKLSKTQEEILKGIHGKLKHGDIKTIAKKTGLTRQYVGMALSKNADFFHEEIVATAVAIVSKREEKQKKLLQTIMAACY